MPGSYRDVKMVKDAGFNFIRGSHYPKTRLWRCCDQLGVLLWSENNFWGFGGATARVTGRRWLVSQQRR